MTKKKTTKDLTQNNGGSISNLRGRQRSKTGEIPIKISGHASGLIMTHDTKKEREILDSVGAGAGLPVILDQREQVKRVARIVAKSMGLTSLESSEFPDQIGFNLKSEAQRRILFAYLKRLTDTGYQGNYQIPTDKEIERNSNGSPANLPKQKEGYQVSSNKMGGAYRNISQIPAIRITKSELMTEAGFNINQDLRTFDKAILSLSKDQHFCLWRRIKRDDKGRIIKNSFGRTEFEIVSQFSPVLNIRGVLNEKNEFQYYEITPPPVFLDQVSEDYGGSYFVLIPSDCEEEVASVVPKGKKTSPFVGSFLFWLRLKYQKIYNLNNNPFYHKKKEKDKEKEKKGESKILPFIEKIEFETLCQEIGITESVYKSQRRRAEDIVRSAIGIAEKIGYLLRSDYNKEEDRYTFFLNEGYFEKVRENGIEESEDQLRESYIDFSGDSGE